MLVWYGKRVVKQIETEINSRLMQSAVLVKETAKKSMPLNLLPNISPVPRSKPGDPPYAQTQKLYKSIDIEKIPERMAVKIGTNVKYGKYLELGTRKMRWRPWLVPALARNMSKIKAIFAKPFVGGSIIQDTTAVPSSTIQLGAGTSELIKN